MANLCYATYGINTNNINDIYMTRLHNVNLVLKSNATTIIVETKQRIKNVHSNLDTGDVRFRGSCADADTGERCGAVWRGEREESVPVTQFATRAPLVSRDGTRGNFVLHSSVLSFNYLRIIRS